MHQVRRLHDQRLHPVRDRAVQGLGDVVDDLAVARLDMVDDDLAGKAAAHAPVGKGFLQRRLDGADGETAAVVEAGAEADDQQLVLADFVGVARIVQRGVAAVAQKDVAGGAAADPRSKALLHATFRYLYYIINIFICK